MKRLPLIVFFIACFAWNNAFALTGAGDAAVVSKLGAIFSQLKKEYETVLKQLREAQAQSQTLVDMKNSYRQVRAEYYFVKNFNLDRELEKIKGDLLGLTLIDNMEGRSLEDQMNLMAKEIDRRFYGDEEKKEQASARLQTIERLTKLQELKREELEALNNGSMSAKNVQSSTAQSNALMAALEFSREQRRVKQELIQLAEEQEKQDQVEAMSQFMRKIETQNNN
jgi:hypothetical protein